MHATRAGPRTPDPDRAVRVGVNALGAASAAFFSYSFLRFYLQTHLLIGVVFFTQQALVAAAYLARRPARAVTRRPADWLLAFGGTYAGLLLRPRGAHLAWGVHVGLALQLVGAAVAVAGLVALGRSFGLAAADRGLVTRGPYAVVRHPMYAAYLLGQAGFLLQSLSVPNGAVLLLSCGCAAGRALAEDRLLATNPGHAAYRRRVRWAMLPGVW